jgi:hypothetical protein
VICNYPGFVICAGLPAQGTVLSRLICLLHKPRYGLGRSLRRKPSTFARSRILHNCAKAERSTGQFGQTVEGDISAVAELPRIHLIGALISCPAIMTYLVQSPGLHSCETGRILRRAFSSIMPKRNPASFELLTRSKPLPMGRKKPAKACRTSLEGTHSQLL